MKRNGQFLMFAALMAASTIALSQVVVKQAPTGSPGILLTRADVQDDLKLSAEVRAKIKGFWDEILKASGATQQGGGTVIRAGHGTSNTNPMESLAQKAMPLLTSGQKARLEQIRIQTNGPRIALDPAVEPKLGLSADQKSKMRKLLDEEQAAISQKVQGAGGRLDATMMGELKAMRKKTDAGIDKLLTKAQKDKIKELGGPAFKSTV